MIRPALLQPTYFPFCLACKKRIILHNVLFHYFHFFVSFFWLPPKIKSIKTKCNPNPFHLIESALTKRNVCWNQFILYFSACVFSFICILKRQYVNVSPGKKKWSDSHFLPFRLFCNDPSRIISTR